ncbi:zinc finger protein OZF-like [Engraulis encrasicolus]|uniref:zinc finger protein OZF-like n=1 Tax=Engraulis encrasicolus TaxID=184585 RepID=UPI002FD1E822
MTMKEIKEEDFDYFLQEFSRRPREDDSTSKEEMSPAIKMEEESNVTGNSHDGMTSIRKVSESYKLVTIKKEIKEEDVDDFLQEYLWQPGQDDSTSRTTCEEEISPAMDIKEEEEFNFTGNSHDGMTCISKESESSQLVTYKKEIKREDFEDSSQRAQENDETKPSFYEEENCLSVDIEEELDPNLINNGNNGMSPTSSPAVNMRAGTTLQCTTCGKVFTHARFLRRHQRLHTGDKTCETCGKYFAKKENLKVHLKIHTGEKPFPCTACGKTFIQKGHLQKHLVIHTGEKPFLCTTCGTSCATKDILQVHLKIHTGEKPFPCTTCGKTFLRKGDLNKHLVIHTGEKPFPCTTCGKSFREGGTLRRHQMIHTDEKPYLCTTCGKAFRVAGDLRRHERTHTGEKPYQCTTCGKAFTQASSLRTHQRSHTGEKSMYH